MSFAIVDDQPATLKQRILDKQLDELVAETGNEEDRYNFGKLVFKCLRDNPKVINSVDVSTGKSLTNGEMLQLSVKAARALRAAGIGSKDVVMIIGVNHLELAIPFYAAFFNDHLPMNVDAGATAFELDNFLRVAQPKIIFSDAFKIDTLKEALATSGVKSTLISFGNDPLPDVDTFDNFFGNFSDDIESYRVADRNRYDPGLLLCTSGSTGLPKVPCLTNYCLVAQLPNFGTCDILHDETEFERGSVKNMLIVTSQWFAYYSAISVAAVYHFHRVQTSLRVTPEYVLQIMRNYRPNTTFVSPHFLSLLLNHPDYKQGDLASMYAVLITGSALSPDLEKEFKAAINPRGIISYTYGCSEVGGAILAPSSAFVPGSLGKAQNIMICKVVDDDYKEVEQGQIGELICKSKELFFKGFYNNPEASKDVVTEDGWIRTGDLVYKNEQGVFFFVDRKKLVITFNNSHVYPTEIEGVVGGVSGVADVAVSGSPRGPVALVVMQPGAKLTEQDIHDVVNFKLSSFKQLVGGIYFVESLPKTSTGKLDRTKLQALVDKLLP